MFQLTAEEATEVLRCQFGASKKEPGRDGRWRQKKQEGRVQYVFKAIQQLIEAPADLLPKRRIGLSIFQTAPEPAE